MVRCSLLLAVCFWSVVIVLAWAAEEEQQDPLTALTAKTYRRYLKKHPKTVLMMYAKFDKSHQRYMADLRLVRAAVIEAKPDVAFATIECLDNHKVCKRLGATGFPPPIFALFNGTKTPAMHPRDAVKPGLLQLKHFLLGADNPTDAAAEEIAQAAVPAWKKSGELVALSDASFGLFHTKHPQMVVIFVKDGCSSSKGAMPGFKVAARTYEELPFVKVDCNDGAAVCHVFDVDETPVIRFFHRIKTLGTKMPMPEKPTDVAALLGEFIQNELQQGNSPMPGDIVPEKAQEGEGKSSRPATTTKDEL